MRKLMGYCLAILVTSMPLSRALAIPHYNQDLIPKDSEFNISSSNFPLRRYPALVDQKNAIPVLRIQVDWSPVGELYILKHTIIENSGTPGLLKRAINRPPWGSYLGVLKSQKDQKDLFYDSVGTGKEFRKLTRAMSFRFPVPQEPVTFELWAENPDSGVLEKVLSKEIKEKDFKKLKTLDTSLDVRCIKNPSAPQPLRLNIYPEGYLETNKNEFFVHAQKTVDALVNQKFPGLENFQICAAFVPSLVKLGEPENLGWPVPETDTFLGLYFPYWDNFGRWYHVIYPTREKRFRDGIAQLPYDYALVLADDSDYWGVGNFMELTAIPAENKNFVYLLLHEFGHFFGLNEEYEGGGRTELEFAPEITEPWSQNITFLANKSLAGLKWSEFVAKTIPLPTPNVLWTDNPPAYGAYLGGYGDSAAWGKSHKPGHSCVMNSGKTFCAICTKGLNSVLKYGMGEPVTGVPLNKFNPHEH